MQITAIHPDPLRCPLCGQANGCQALGAKEELQVSRSGTTFFARASGASAATTARQGLHLQGLCGGVCCSATQGIKELSLHLAATLLGRKLSYTHVVNRFGAGAAWDSAGGGWWYGWG